MHNAGIYLTLHGTPSHVVWISMEKLLNIFALHPASLTFSHLLCPAHRTVHLITPLS